MTLFISKSFSSSVFEKKSTIIHINIDDESLRVFARNFMVDMYKYSSCYKNIQNKEEFLEKLKSQDLSDESIIELYKNHNVNFDEMIDAKNAIDNDIKDLQNRNPELINSNIPEAQIWENIISQIQNGLDSHNPDWISVENQISEDLASLPSPSHVTSGELWGCIKTAIGISAGPGLGMGLLAETSTSLIIKTVTRMLIRNMGWWGAALFIIDFTVCIHEAEVN